MVVKPSNESSSMTPRIVKAHAKARQQPGMESREWFFALRREGQGITRLQDVQPVHMASYIEQLAREMSPLSVKQHLACIRMCA
jgi:hypothetical protein